MSSRTAIKANFETGDAPSQAHFEDLIDSLAHVSEDGLATSASVTSGLAGKQATLVSGTNIKTVNGSTLLGSGDLTISGGGTIDATLIDGSTNAVQNNAVFDGLATKQATLVSATNIKTINSTSLLGSGDLAVATAAQGTKADTAMQPGDQRFAVATDATTARTLALTDAQKYIRFTSSSAVAVTVPLQVTVAWAADTEIILFQAGTGAITVAGAGGVTINTPETLVSGKQYATMTLKRVASNEWDLSGNLVSA